MKKTDDQVGQSSSGFGDLTTLIANQLLYHDVGVKQQDSAADNIALDIVSVQFESFQYQTLGFGLW